MVPRTLWLRTLRSARLVAGAAAPLSPRSPLGPRAPPAERRGPRGAWVAMAARERSPPRRAGAHELEAEAPCEAGENGQPLSTSSQLLQQTDGRQIVERKKKQRKKRKEESRRLDDSVCCLMMEMPFAKADIEDEFSNKSAAKPYVKKTRKRTTGRESEEDNLIKKKKKNQDKPNYFISVPITNPKITDTIQLLQDKIIQKDSRLSKAMVHCGSLHITLSVLHLASEEAVDNAVGAFMASKDLIEELLQGKPLDLSFQGTDHFRHQVGFVKLTDSDHATTLLKIADIVRKIFKEKGIVTGDDKAFKPHLTFMKLSKSPKLRKQGVKRIDPTLFENFKNHHFGDESMKRLDLCSMLKKKQPNGYYHCESSIIVGKSQESDVIKEALHRELLALLSKLNQIKALLSSPEIRMKMHKELLGKGLVSGSIWDSFTNPAPSVS
uniref:A-kinase anchoring protein 7 isoform X2 n=1 Tax=Podarcis muralis TaxID=64176 RepID=UPI00109F6730|nr:A-kinase anchoring protein 7 isoform X2 [Podarcis muralis]